MGLEVSDSQAATLADFETLLEARAVGFGLIAEADRGRLRERHVLDCLRAAATVGPEDREAYDLGSGAGLPGVVVAIARPELRLTLVEARLRRVAFLELAVSRLGLSNVLVRHARVEDLTRPVGLCFARAFSSLEASWRVARRLLRPGGRLVYFAGDRWTLPNELLEGASSCLATGPVLESSGPLVIMTRQ
jgi:16S rRNA (guanine527-N7)-methyltransferase